jgi:1-deoxy-D-xylulose-5-phosphate synthase
MNLLSHINTPVDLRKLSPGQLRQVCDELRAFLIDTVSKTGGHFAGNLGTVELTVALHYVFNTPQDKLIWDVGHQAYPHKILTGRKKAFENLRQYGGISGFPKMDESPYDAFGTGHSSTSISAILGMAAAAKIKGELHRHIAVIGDGAMSAGQAFEGLNNLGFLKLPVLIILNDNHMGIDPVSGALNDYLGKLKEGEPNLFTRLGMEYSGPYDGHDIDFLIKKLNEVKDLPHPVFLHLKTVKGKGFKPAEEEQTSWHATSGFDKINPLDKPEIKQSVKFQDIAGKTLLKLAEENKDIVAITPAMISGSSLHLMQNKFPDRVFDVGIAEQHAVTFAAGLAASGLKPFCFIYSTFLQRAMDQVIHDVCLQKLNVVFCIDRAGLVGEDGPTHHGAFDLSMLQAIPNTILSAASSLADLSKLMELAAKHQDGPFFIRYPRGTGLKESKAQNFEIGKACTIEKGSDIALISYGSILSEVQQVAEMLKDKGHNPTLVDMRFLKPLDTSVLSEIAKTHSRLFTFEDAAAIGGLGSAVSKWLHENHYENQLKIFGLPDIFIPHGKNQQLMESTQLSGEKMTEEILKTV